MLVAGTGVAGYRLFDSRALEPGVGRAYDAWSHWQDPGPIGMVAAAILAANPHNTQPWRFRITDRSIDLFADPTRGLGSIDPFQREMHVGLGCAVENLVLAAAPRGYQANLTLLPGPDPTHIAHLGLSPTTVASSSLYDAIGDRNTNRGPYEDRPIPPSVLTDLAGRGGDLAGVGVRWLTEPAQRAAMGALLLDATQQVVGDEQQSLDGFAWFRSSADDIERHKDGLTIDAQGLSASVAAIGKLLPASTRQAGDQFWLDQTRTVHIPTAAAYGVITVGSAGDPAARLSGGRLLERIHLDATRRGIALQPMNQITERIDREADLDRPPTFAPRFAAMLDAPGREALVTFRLGYPVRIPVHSPRRPAPEVST